MVFLIAHKFLFSLVTPLATTIQHFPQLKLVLKPQFPPIKTVSCFVRMIFTCLTAKLCHLWLQNIAISQFEC